MGVGGGGGDPGQAAHTHATHMKYHVHHRERAHAQSYDSTSLTPRPRVCFEVKCDVPAASLAKALIDFSKDTIDLCKSLKAAPSSNEFSARRHGRGN